MLTRFDISRRRVALGIGVAALTIGTVSLAWANVTGSTPTASFTPASSTESVGDVSGPCDEAENAAKPECAATASSGTGAIAAVPTTAAAAPRADGTDVRTFDAAGAGTVTYTVDGSHLTLLEATPTSGWTVEVERGAGLELDLDFRAGARRVQVDVEFEDGDVRERVRIRDDALGTESETINGTATDDADDDDSSGPDDSPMSDDRSGPSGTSGDDDPGEEDSDDGSDDDGLDDDDSDDHGQDEDGDDDGHDDDGSDDDRSGSSSDDD